MDSSVIVFFLVYISQVIVVSGWYPRRFAARVNWVADNLPADAYPKLYPDAPAAYTPARAKGAISIFMMMNNIIMVAGLFILTALAIRGYHPSEKGGDEIFVILFFFLQMVPWTITEISIFRHVRRMREAGIGRQRSTDLRPRQLGDYVNPGWVILAAVLFVTWLVYYLGFRLSEGQNGAEIVLTIVAMTAANGLYIFTVNRAISGANNLPGQSRPDQDRAISVVVKACVAGSIGCSVFLMLTQFADDFALEYWDPVFTSIFFQVLIFFGMGNAYRSIGIEEFDFEPWHEKPGGGEPETA